MSAGKGSNPRPFSVPLDQYEKKHEAIFGKRERPRYVPPPIARELIDSILSSSVPAKPVDDSQQ
jgi:hypothetical protein